MSNTNDFRGVFGEVLDTVKDTFGNLLQLLTNLKNKEIEFDFHKKINYGLPFGIIFITSNSDNPIDIDNKTKKLESCFRDAIKHPFYCPFTIGNDSDFREILLEFLENIPKAPNEIPQFLTNFKNSKIPNEKISFSPPKDYPSLYKVYGYFKREVRDTLIKEQMNEEIKINPSFCNYRVDSEQNRKINEIVEGLKSGKIIGN
ncbi:hypothetical protein AOH178_13310 [Helicobacter pylori]